MDFWKAHGKKLLAWIAGAFVAVCIGGEAYGDWYWTLDKFQDVTMELGSPMPAAADFLTEYGSADMAKLVTDAQSLDLTAAGVQEVKLSHGNKVETVKLTIVDTTAPEARFQNVVTRRGNALAAQDFIVSTSDLSPVTVAFAQPLQEPEHYGDVQVEVVVTDASGNETTGLCTISYVWMVDSFTMELGEKVEKADLLLDVRQDRQLIDQAQLDQINASPAGTYTVTSTDEGEVRTCTVTVVDTIGPTLTLQDVSIYDDGTAALEDFVVVASDLSGDVSLRLTEALPLGTVGSHTVTVEAEDIFGNVTTAQAVLEIVKDTVGPTFSGVSELQVKKNSTPNYEKGVAAYDAKDGYCSFTFDASKVDTSKSGTFYVTYTAYDKSGNKGTYRRKVVVDHDAADTKRLAAEIAATLSNDPEAIRDYVRNNIAYSSNWGGDDPAWYGFKNKQGNCYVHALCLKALLDCKGYQTQVIWTTDKTHYWLIIKLGDVWRHIDATPGTRHSKYSLMDDDQRFETLQTGVPGGRDWDHSQWPACE